MRSVNIFDIFYNLIFYITAMATLSNNYLFQTMNTNNLLLKKDDIGVRKESCYDLP